MKNKIIDCISDNYGNTSLDWDFTHVEVEGVKYGIELVESLPTIDEGKYQYGGNVFKVGVFNEDKKHGIEGDILFYIRQNFTQCGSYFSEQYFEYDEVYEVEPKEIVKIEWEAVK